MAGRTLVWIQRTPSKGAACVALDEAVLRTDFGLEGDRHARPASSRQVVLVAAEVLDDLRLPYGATREQLTIAGLDEVGAGDLLTIGEAVIELVRPRVPCRIMERVRPGLERELRGRGGWCGRVVRGGRIRLGEPVARTGPEGADPPWLLDYLAALAEWEASPPTLPLPGEWDFAQRLAHLVAWDERGATRIAAVAGGAAEETWDRAQIDAFNAAAVARLCRDDGQLSTLWDLHDTWSTAVVEAARRHPAHAETWVRSLAAHYREHA
jgi:hypothetical protein